jgi:hypothetical protein
MHNARLRATRAKRRERAAAAAFCLFHIRNLTFQKEEEDDSPRVSHQKWVRVKFGLKRGRKEELIGAVYTSDSAYELPYDSMYDFRHMVYVAIEFLTDFS